LGLGEFPEGLTVDKNGNIYVGLGAPLGPYGEIRKIAPDGTESIYFQMPGGPGPSGLAVDNQGALHYALFAAEEEKRGVYKVTGPGVSTRLPGTGSIILPNGLAFDQQGNLYVTDSIPGIVWRIPRNGPAEAWFQHDSLTGCGFDPNLPPVGANGIVFWHNSLYVASTEQGIVLRIPINPDGSTGESEIIAGDAGCSQGLEGLVSLDGMAMDVHGNIFGALVIQNKVVKIDTDTGEYIELLDASDGLHNPASLAFGTGKGSRQTLYFTNFALIQPGPAEGLGPAVLGYDAGVAGLPLP
jgi:sugar lactone lactonase YvrE